MNHLSDNFYRNPEHASAVMTRKQLKETLLDTGGWILEVEAITNKSHRSSAEKIIS